MKLRWRALFAGMMLITGVALSSCTDTPTESILTSSVHLEPEEELGQMITIIPADPQKSGKENANYKIQTRLTDFQLMNEQTGLVWGITHNTLRLYYTHDGGKAWTNISPSENVEFPSTLDYGKDIYFTDARHGWIVRQGSDHTATIILRTDDGGQSWDISALPQGANVSVIQFVSQTHGWIMATTPVTGTKEQKILFHSADAGATWQAYNSTENISNSSSKDLPENGIVTGMSFADDQQGYIAMMASNGLKLYATSNGGKKWIHVPSGIHGCSAFVAEFPQPLGSNRMDNWLPLSCTSEGTVRFSGLFTNDAGQHWNYRPMELRAKANSLYSAQTFLNSKEGWVMVNKLVYKTTDGGISWNNLPVDHILASKLAAYVRPVKLRFVSSSLGWLLIEKLDDKKSLLLKTTDGGTSWRVL